MADESTFGAGEFPGEAEGYSAAPPPVPAPAASGYYELRPLTTGEILDRTFYLYRNNFWLFVGISTVSATASTIGSLAQMVYLHLAGVHVVLGQRDPRMDVLTGLTSSLLALLAGVLYLMAYGVTQAATTSAVTKLYLGETTTLGASYRAVGGKWLRYFGIALWQVWSFFWVFCLLMIPVMILAGMMLPARIAGGGTAGAVGIGLVIFLVICGAMAVASIMYIRNSLAVPAAVIEGLGVRKAIRRSRDLAAGTKWRIFLLFFAIAVLYIVLAMAEYPLTMGILQGGHGHLIALQAIKLFVGFVALSLVGGVPAIGLTLFYFDQRVRKEAFDIDFMLMRSGAGLAPAVVVVEPVLEAVVEVPVAEAAVVEDAPMPPDEMP